MTFLKYIFNHTKPCLHNVKELAGDHRSEKNFAKAEKVSPGTQRAVVCSLMPSHECGLMVSFSDSWNQSSYYVPATATRVGDMRWTSSQSPDLRNSPFSTLPWQFLPGCLHSCFPGGAVVKNPPAKAGDADLIPGLGRSPGGGHGNPLQYSCLENSMDRGE